MLDIDWSSDLLGLGLALLLLDLLGLLGLALLLGDALALGLLPVLLGLHKVPLVLGVFLLEVLNSGRQYLQAGAALGTLTGVPVNLWTLLGSAILETLEKCDSVFRGEVLVDPLAVDLDHGGVDTGPETLDLLDGEESVRGGMALLDAEVLLAGGDDSLGAAQLAGRGAADLQVELADLFAVEHGVEGCHLSESPSTS